MTLDGLLSMSVAAVVDDVLRQHGSRSCDSDLASRKAEETVTRRNEAAGWLRKIVGAVSAKDLPEEPTEEEFRLGLRNGQILCSALNKVHPGAVAKVVVNPGESQPEGAALSAYQYFENVRNFLVAMEEMGLPCFEASDLEQGGKSTRVVNCILALKSYSEWRQFGGSGPWKYGGNMKQSGLGRSFVRKNSEPFQRSFTRSLWMSDTDFTWEELNIVSDNLVESSEAVASRPLQMLVSAILSDRRPDEVPTLIESLLRKLVEEFEHRISCQTELKTGCIQKSLNARDPSKEEFKKHMIILQQERDVKELRQTLDETKAGVQFMQIKYLEELKKFDKHLHGLAHAASEYHRVVEENRKLYNQVQDLKGNIRVYCRVRPFLPGQLHTSTIAGIDEGNITIATPAKYSKDGRKSFSFNKVFGPSCTQEEVFLDTQPLIRSVLDGYNVCMFAYGQTGSGKTYTMSGPKNMSEQTCGVNFRALSDLFKLVEQRKGSIMYEIAVQMIEIYNEQVRDLLVNDGISRRLEIRNNSQNGLNVPDANLVQVASTSEVLELMNVGHKNRAVGATALNDRSSRSHSCLTVHVQGRDMTSGTFLRGCMHLVDLAGSERVDKSEVTGERLKEAQYINKSLSALGDVIASLAQKNSHVPYRNSKLTQLLQDSLGGQAKTLMFVHISPESDAVGETISTLKFAERVSTVELGAARVNKETREVRELKEQIARLQSALAMKERDPENFQDSVPLIEGLNATTLTPMVSAELCVLEHLNAQENCRQPMEEVGNIKFRSNLSLRQKKPSFDRRNIVTTNESSWPASSARPNIHVGDDRDTISAEWIDKVVINMHDASARIENAVGEWDEDNAPSTDFFYQRYHSDVMFSDTRFNRSMTRRKNIHDFEESRTCYHANTDDSDELEVATSDSSEPDALWQFNMQNTNQSGNNGGPRVKTQPRPGNGLIVRAPRAHVPSPSKKIPDGTNPSRKQRLVAAGDSKRTLSSNSKLIRAK